MTELALVTEVKKRVHQAMRERDELAKNVLRVALGEIQMFEVRSERPATEAEAVATIRKLVKSNEETVALTGEGERAEVLRKEIAILTSLLPATMSIEALVAALADCKDALLAAKGDGQATGIALKHLKTVGGTFQGNDVAAAVKLVRG